jgi:hypothetical protein
MIGWEYKVLHLPGSDPAMDEEFLNLHGSKGWEVQAILVDGGGKRVCYLKRPTDAQGEITLSMKPVPAAVTDVGRKPTAKKK